MSYWDICNANGFRQIQRSSNRLTIIVQARRADVERAFKVRILDYRLRGREFYANAEPPAVPPSLAPHIQVIAGLSNIARPVRPVETFTANDAADDDDIAKAAGLPAIAPDVKTTLAVCGVSPKSPGPSLGSSLIQVLEVTFVNLAKKLNLFIDAACVGLGSATGASWATCNAMALALGPGVWTANPQCAEFRSFGLGGPFQPQVKAQKSNVSNPSVTSNPQKIGLLEFDTYNQADVQDWLTFIGGVAPFALPTEVPVNGGVASPGPEESEVLLDIDTVMALDTQPATSYVVYDAPPGTTFETIFNAMINDGDTVISNSWAQCEDQTTQAEASAIDSILQTAAASGISVLNGTGDNGSTCLDGSANVIAVPADSPNATAVGGSTPMPGPGLTFGTEAWWNGVADTPPTGQGGFGVSKYFQAPSSQGGLGGMRSVPDVVVDADPSEGIQICQADAGGCPTPLRYGGTSMAAPEWAAYVADLNSLLGSNLGAVNPRFYALAGTSAFHNPTVLGSDSSHVGIGSPDFLQLRLALTGQTPGVPVSANSFSVAGWQQSRSHRPGRGPNPGRCAGIPA